MDFSKIVDLIVNPTSSYSKGCLMVQLPDTVCSFWKVWEGLIDPNDLDEDGFEDEPHVTVQYGFDPDVTIQEVIAKVEPIPCEIKFGSFGLFENDNDVLKINIISPDLRKLNKKIMEEFEIDTKYPDYKPHATIAYLKKGMGKKYMDKLKNPLKDKTTISNLFVYSSPKYSKEYFYAFDNKDFFN